MSLRFSSSGHSGRVNLGTSPSAIETSTALTVCAWIAPESAPGWMLGYASATASSPTYRHWLGFGGGNVFFERNYSTAGVFSYGGVPSDGRWQFICGVDNGPGNAPDLYQGEEDSVLADIVTTARAPSGTLAGGSPSLCLFNDPNDNNGFHGKAAFFAFFDASLTQAELEAIQFNPIAASLARSDLVAIYMPGMHGTSNVYDFSGNGQDSTSLSGTTPTLNDLPAVNWGFPDLGSDYTHSTASGTTHNLTVDSVTSTSSTGTPDLGQTHALAADNVTGASSTATPDVSQTHTLAVDDITSSSSVGNPTADTGQTYNLTVDGIASTPSLDNPTPGVIYGLSVDSITSAPSLGTPDIGQNHTFTADNINSQPNLGTPDIAQAHALSVNNITSMVYVGEANLDPVASTSSGHRALNMKLRLRM